jgi:predicted DNA-binding transcriptional regulator YafY
MPTPTNRVLALLELLQNADELSGTELTRQLEVDSRTLRRYITRLQDMGVPVQSVRGRYGAYRLMPGSKLPPLILTDPEAVAVSIGLLFARQLGLADTVAGAHSAQAKLERVMPPVLCNKLRAVSSAVQLELSQPVATLHSESLLEMSAAAQDRYRVRLRYQAANQEATEREFDCYGLAWRSGRWYAVGHCHLRAGLRSFRLDRIQSVTPLAVSFLAPFDFDAVRHLALGLATMPRRHAIVVRLMTSLATAQAELFDAIGVFRPLDDAIMLYSQADDLPWFARQLARVSFDFEVLQPPELREAIKACARHLLGLAEIRSSPKT